MLAMQYSIPLPVNYDAAKIHDRVATRRGLFDDHAGLVHKSYLYNDHDKLYAPFYVWKDVAQARDFLLDDLFAGVVDAFNRHRVRNWFVVHMAYGNRDLKPSFARREVDIIAPEEKLEKFVAQEKAEQEAMLKDKNLYLQVVALDADRWELLRFSLWKDEKTAAKPYSDSFLQYQVLHVSEPK